MLVLISGEAVAGKTLLLRSFCGRQRAALRVLWGACEPVLTPRPLGPILDLAEVVNGELGELAVAGARPHEVAGALMRELQRDAATVLVGHVRLAEIRQDMARCRGVWAAKSAAAARLGRRALLG